MFQGAGWRKSKEVCSLPLRMLLRIIRNTSATRNWPELKYQRILSCKGGWEILSLFSVALGSAKHHCSVIKTVSNSFCHVLPGSI
jgi:hypothetical protein